MNKNKEKDHPQAEAGKTAKIADQPAVELPSPEAETKPAAHAAPRAGQATEPTDAKKLQKAMEEIEQLKDQLLRMRADYDNFRKRSLREKGEIYENANEALLLDLLPVLDHFQLAVKSSGERKHHSINSTGSLQADSHGPELGTKAEKADKAFYEGIRMILDQMMSVLGKYGLAPFSVEKKSFDPRLHEAISSLPSATEPEGAILAQTRQGYLYNEKLLRPAQVVVSGGGPKDLVKTEKTTKTGTEPADTDVQSDEE